MGNFFKRPVVIAAMVALFGITAWQTESILAALAIGTVIFAGWAITKGAPLAQAITLPVAIWAGGYGGYDTAASGSTITVIIVSTISYMAGALYLLWLIPMLIRHGLNWESFVKGAIGIVIVSVVLAFLSSLAG